MADTTESPNVHLPQEAESVITGIVEGAKASVLPSDEPDVPPREALEEKPDTKRLVRLDKMCLGIWLMAGRFLLKDQANSVKQIQKAALNVFDNFADVQGAKFLIKKLSWRAIPGVAAFSNVVNEMKRFFDIKATQNSLGRHIRNESLIIRKDLVKSAWGAKDWDRRRTKVVYTRHPGPKQRKANQSWRSPKA